MPENNMPVNKKKIKRGPRSNQKLKIMYLMKILLEETDETHDITLIEIAEKLKAYNVTAERKSLYDDIENLRTYGMDIIGSQYGRTYHYKVINRQFELVELKLLVDAVSAAKFISEKKSNELIKKIESFASRHDAEQLRRQVNVNGRVKSMNERVYYSVDTIHTAINANVQIEFQYFSWNVNRKMELRNGGRIYHVSPWALCWDDEKYYLVGYDVDDSKIKHFRVDKMLNANITEIERTGQDEFKEIKLSDYTNRMFGMFEGSLETVTLRCPNEMANVIIDRFGKDVVILKENDGYFTAKVKVAVTDLFIGWIMALKNVKIVEPKSVIDKVREQIMTQWEMYK